MSPILVKLTDSDFEPSKISFKENKQDGVDLVSRGLDNWARKNERKLYSFSAD